MHYPFNHQCISGTMPYTIQKGDTLYQIARRYHTSIRTLVRLNPAINPYILWEGQQICVPKFLKEYKNPTYNVELMYPAQWEKVDETRYEGKNGFFQVSAIASSSVIEDVCKSEAFHKLKPYGSAPMTRKTKRLGQEACFIIPAADQPPEMKNQAAFIITYPAMIQIGQIKYNYFLLWADKDHIVQIVDTLKFLSI